MLIESHSFGPAETNTYLVACSETKQAVIIDAPSGSIPWLLKHIKTASLSVQAILLTHSHWDHVADIAALKTQLQVPLYVHKEDAGNVKTPGSDGLPLFFHIDGIEPDGFLEEGQQIQIGNLHIEVIHTPGHSPGSVCFYLKTQKVLFSGDTLFRGTIGSLSLPTARPSLMCTSLRRLAELPQDTKVYPGHGEPTTIGAEQWIARAKPHT